MDKKTFALALLDTLRTQNVVDSWKYIADRQQAELHAARTKLDAYPRDAGTQKAYYDAQRVLLVTQEKLTKLEEAKHAIEEAEFAARSVSSPSDMINLRIAKERLESALTLGRSLAAGLPNQVDNIQRAVLSLPKGPTRQSLLVMIEQAKQGVVLLNQADAAVHEMEILQANIEQWFDDAMDRVGGWYKRWTQKVVLGIAVVLVLVANADTVMFIKKFSRDSVLRASMIAAAEEAVRVDTSANATSTGEVTPTNPDVGLMDSDAILRDAANLALLPIGWIPDPKDRYGTDQNPGCANLTDSKCLWAWVYKVFGLLMTVIAVQLGAPFWFDTLSKFVNLRSAGTPPGESAKSGPQSARNTALELAKEINKP
jgi:hypothetical protein